MNVQQHATTASWPSRETHSGVVGQAGQSPDDKRQSAVNQLLERHAVTLLNAALDYCSADELDMKGQVQRERLKQNHLGGGICCVPVQQPFDPDGEPLEALPESEWCSYCKEYFRDAIDVESAKHRRRSARQRMKRAYRKILALRPPLADQIVALSKRGLIKHRFRLRDAERLLKGMFSDTEIREGLFALTARGSKERDPRFTTEIRSVGKRGTKYTYEIIC
jgi:hypothetical protein